MSEHKLPDFELPIESAVLVSRLVYYFAAIRGVVRKHEKHYHTGLSAEEETEMQLVAFDTPSLVDTRESAYNPFPTAKMHNPVTFAAVREFLNRNKKYFSQPDITAAPEFVPDGSNEGKIVMIDILTAHASTFDADIIEFDDKFSDKGLDAELIYAVIVNRSVKEITVVFRGTVNPKDMLVDANFFKQENPIVAEVAGNGALVHSGFSDYLCGETHDGKSQLEQIVAVLKEVYDFKERDYSDFTVRVTGHSLGGALAQLLSFLLAGWSKADFIPKPIRAVTIASPVVGESKFFEAYRKLEQDNQVRHVRISNDKDVICGNPFWSYTQTGVNIHLYQDAPAAVGYDTWHHVLQLVSTDPMARHSVLGPGGYHERLYAMDSNGDYINSMVLGKSIDQLYDDYADLANTTENGTVGCFKRVL